MDQSKITLFLYKGEQGRTLRIDIWNEASFRHIQQILLHLKASEKEMYNCGEDDYFSLYNLENFCIAKYKGDKYIGVNSRKDEAGKLTITWFVNDERLNELIPQMLALKNETGSHLANKPGEYATIELAYREELG